MHCGPPAFADTAPQTRAVNADRSLPEVNPILRENWVPLPQGPASQGRPISGQGGV